MATILPWEEAQQLSSPQSKAIITQPAEAPPVAPEGKPDTTLKAPWEEAQELAKTAYKGVVATVDNVVPKVKGRMPWEEAQQAAVPKAPPIMEIHRPPNQFNEILQKVINTESAGKHTDEKGNLTTSPKGAQGLTQVMPATGVDPGFGVQPLQNQSEAEYKRFGTQYLQALHKNFDGDWPKTLAAYNWGVGNVEKAIKKNGDQWKTVLPAETKNYLKKILGK